MTFQRPARNWPRLILALSFGLSVSCGSVGEPLPPLLHIPGRVEDFTVRQDASELVAEWTWPVHGSEGQVFREMARFEVYSLLLPPGGAVPSADALNNGELLTTAPATAADTTGPGTHVTVHAPLSAQYGSRRAFAVRGVSTRGRTSSWSELRLLDVVPPPAAPTNLIATTVEQGVSLVWNSVEGATSYDVERRLSDGEFTSIAQPDSAEYLDAAPQWGASQAYRVRAVKPAGESPGVPGPASNIVGLTPTDVFPPAPPVDLRALPTDGGVELSWSSNREPDLAGYRVLRDGSPVHPGLLESANFSDQPLSPGQSAVYQVFAVDRAGNASGPAEVQAVSPR